MTTPRTVALVLSCSLAPLAAQATGFSFDVVRARARELSQRDWVAESTDDLPAWLLDLDYDAYRRVRFRPSMALWSDEGLPFRIEFAHRGYLFHRRVPIHVVGAGAPAELRFDPQQFDYDLPQRGEVPATLGYAGFTVRYPLERQDRWDDVASFRGASYFRLLGRGQGYGASARGLAIDTATESGEEFPEFVEMWIERPEAGAKRLTIYALLDSPSVAGAYRFVLTPGEPTVVEVDVALFPRKPVAKLGLAPLTSMFLFGEAGLRRLEDYRPEVHDSDGLQVADAAGGWIWRPLVNPAERHRVTRLPLPDPLGFGLVQRDRRFASYEDLESRFEKRPTYWVTPRGRWGGGTLELVEIPSDAEGNDNVAAFWVPEVALEPGRETTWRYELSARLDELLPPTLARVRGTLVRRSEAVDLFVLDFEGGELGEDIANLRADIAAEGADLRNVVLQRNEAAGGVRCAFEVASAGKRTIELRARLLREERPISETWTLQWQKR